MRQWLLLGALVLPILGLSALMGFKAYKLHSGYEMTLPVEGYDPRDLLSGRYVTYRVDYGPAESCTEHLLSLNEETGADHAARWKTTSRRHDLCICYPEPSSPTSGYWMDCASVTAQECPVYIKGECYWDRFETGVEKYFVPETQADAYDAILREHGADLTIKVDRQGRASLVELTLPMSIEEWRRSQKKEGQNEPETGEQPQEEATPPPPQQ